MSIKVMKCISDLLLLCMVTCSSLLPAAWAFSQGAKPSSCVDMEPGHIRAQPQDPHHSHLTLQTAAHSYLPGDTLSVAVRSTRDFMGFLLQARTVKEDLIAGAFVLLPPGSRALSCMDAADTVTHSDKLLKRNLSFIWRAPDTPVGDIRFLITVVQSYFVYWARIESAVVHDGTGGLDGDAMGGGPPTNTPYQMSTEGGETGNDTFSWTRANPMPGTALKVQPNDGVTSRGSQREKEEPGINSTLPTYLHEDPRVPALSNDLSPITDLPSLTVSPDLAQTRGRGQRPSTDPQPCHDCEQGGQISVGPGPMGPSGTEAPTEPQQPQRSPLAAPNPEIKAPPSFPRQEPSPAPRRSHSHLVTQVNPPAPTLRQTPPPGFWVRKVMVTQNLSRGGEVGLPEEGGAGGAGKGVGQGKGGGAVSHRSALELGVLLGCSAGLGMVLAVGLRYLHSQYCLKRTAVSLSERQGDAGIIHLQDSGELVQIRKIRQNSFVLLQAEYNVMTPPGN